MLNLLQRACGIASATRAYVDAVAGTRCRILHTRKTAPGSGRSTSPRCSPAAAHATGPISSHEVMVKDNHWQALRLERTRRWPPPWPRRARRGVVVAPGRSGVAGAAGGGLRRRRHPAAGGQSAAGDGAGVGGAGAGAAAGIEIEATGGITLANVRAYAEAGVDFVSIGALTHSVTAADLGLEVVGLAIASD